MEKKNIEKNEIAKLYTKWINVLQGNKTTDRKGNHHSLSFYRIVECLGPNQLCK